MPDKMRDDKYILQMLKYIARLNKYCKNKTLDEFLCDDMCSDACILMISEIGEKESSLSDNFKNEHNDISWAKIKAMRNIMIHNYEGVNLNIVWDTINENIPLLEETLSNIIIDEYIDRFDSTIIAEDDIYYLPTLDAFLNNENKVVNKQKTR